jgi:transposase-like protein
MDTLQEIKILFDSLDNLQKKNLLMELNIELNHAMKDDFIQTMDCCPYCKSELIVKNGHKKNQQRFKCKKCHKIFTSTTGTSIHGIKKIEKFEEYKKLMFEQYQPLRALAEKVGISIQTAFDWRHKILSGLSSSPIEFKGITEMDDLWFLYSQKGRKGLKYSRKRGGSSRAGDNNYQVKLLVTADRLRNRDFSVAKIGRITKKDIERKVGGKFNDSCTLVSDKHRSISAFAKAENIKHISFISSKHTAGGEFHVQNVNNMASRLKSIVNHRFRGVSTKYLQNYSNWFALQNSVSNEEKNIFQVLNTNNTAWGIFTNLEDYYKDFIDNQSKRTYRCPTKRKWVSKLNSNEYAKVPYL